MKLKDFIVPVALSFITLWGIQYFIGNKDGTKPEGQPRPGQSFVAPTQQEMTKPLQTSFAFEQLSGRQEAALTSVPTAYGAAHFSARGAVLEELSFKRSLSGKEQVLMPISSESERKPAFIVALDGKVPADYALLSQEEIPEGIRLKYQAQADQAVITKVFIVHRTLPRIDLELTLEPRHQGEVQARLFVPAPWIAAADKDYVSMGLVYTDRQRLQKQPLNKLGNQFWFEPALFGAEDRYFINALIADTEGFTRRAYYTGTTTAEQFSFILEGPTVKEAKTWNLSFYSGPKDAHSMDAVDKRLNAALDYGWLSPLVKFLLGILKFIYGYVQNYGWAIILLTLLIRLVMLPITLRGASAKMQEKQKEFQRKMQYIEQKHKNDPEALNRERLELTRKYGVSNVMGCLPQLIQIPILLGLNRLLSTSVELYQAPFIGWITDLSARDPYYVLPVLAGLGLLVQVTVDTDIRKGITMLLFAALLVAITAHLSAGLTLYLCANAWLSLAQTYFQKAFKI